MAFFNGEKKRQEKLIQETENILNRIKSLKRSFCNSRLSLNKFLFNLNQDLMEEMEKGEKYLDHSLNPYTSELTEEEREELRESTRRVSIYLSNIKILISKYDEVFSAINNLEHYVSSGALSIYGGKQGYNEVREKYFHLQYYQRILDESLFNRLSDITEKNLKLAWEKEIIEMLCVYGNNILFDLAEK